ncbi:hypothetical protein C8F04DRAFT_1272654 [Mycena alexandri]|uniref:Uncharacterized protein n=1 Tax=Mycena alexandri TaxID=1745969 RepID=A0AAD6S735_9AGAR|nr:hypothetical protein C8F04DRAFT_1272654 [Mycena alexandri]
MPEGNEISFLRKYLLDFFPRLQKWLSKEALNRPLELVKIWTDVRGMEVADLEKREEFLLAYAKTLKSPMLKDGTHVAWVRRLHKAADAIPDTHGLMIHHVNLCFSIPLGFKADL